MQGLNSLGANVQSALTPANQKSNWLSVSKVENGFIVETQYQQVKRIYPTIDAVWEDLKKYFNED